MSIVCLLACPGRIPIERMLLFMSGDFLDLSIRHRSESSTYLLFSDRPRVYHIMSFRSGSVKEVKIAAKLPTCRQSCPNTLVYSRKTIQSHVMVMAEVIVVSYSRNASNGESLKFLQSEEKNRDSMKVRSPSHGT